MRYCELNELRVISFSLTNIITKKKEIEEEYFKAKRVKQQVLVKQPSFTPRSEVLPFIVYLPNDKYIFGDFIFPDVTSVRNLEPYSQQSFCT